MSGVSVLLLAALVLVALDDGESAGVLVVLHHEPGQDHGDQKRVSFTDDPVWRSDGHSPAKSLLVLAVHLARLLELSGELLDALGIILGVDVDDEGVDHVCGYVCVAVCEE